MKTLGLCIISLFLLAGCLTTPSGSTTIIHSTSAGVSSTNVTIWNGTNWANYTVGGTNATQMVFSGCPTFTNYCQPLNQNNATNQAILQVQNNGTSTGLLGLQMALNATASWFTVSCGTDSSASNGTLLTTSYQVVNNTAIATGAYYLVYCWMNIPGRASTPNNFQILANVT